MLLTGTIKSGRPSVRLPTEISKLTSQLKIRHMQSFLVLVLNLNILWDLKAVSAGQIICSNLTLSTSCKKQTFSSLKGAIIKKRDKHLMTIKHSSKGIMFQEGVLSNNPLSKCSTIIASGSPLKQWQALNHCPKTG